MRNRYSRNKVNPVIAAVIGVFSVGVIWAGFGETSAVITACSANSKVYVTAEYSEYIHDTCYDSEGKSYDCSYTDYWSEPASEIFTVSTFDGVPTFGDEDAQDAGYLTAYGYYTTNLPERWESLKHDSDFDNFQNHHNISHTVYMNRMGENGTMSDPDHVTKTPSWYNSCMKYKEDATSVSVNTWYGWAYSVEEFTE